MLVFLVFLSHVSKKRKAKKAIGVQDSAQANRPSDRDFAIIWKEREHRLVFF